jgi:hypothetical protein
MTDESERRDTPTIEAPPPSDTIPPPPNAPTGVGENPPTLRPAPLTQAELDAEASAIRASLTPAGISKVAADNLIAMFQYSRRRDFDLLDPEGGLAKQQQRLLGNFKTQVVDELGAVVERITQNAMRSLGERIEGLARGQSRQGEDIDQLKRDFALMRDRMTSFEQKIQDIDDRTPRPTPGAPPAAKPT